MSKRSPFDYVKSINEKCYEYDLAGYNPFLTNRCFAMHMDTVMLAEEMNKAHDIPPECQYDFYYYSVRKGKRFGFPPKPVDNGDVELIMEYYEYSRRKAEEVIALLTPQQITAIKASRDTGGR